MEVKWLFRAQSPDALCLEGLGKVAVLGRISIGGQGTSHMTLPSSEQRLMVHHRYLKTSALLQIQPMIIMKTCFPLQIFLALFCMSFVVSKIHLQLINAIRNYLIFMFKERKPGSSFKTLFLGVFTWERKLNSSAEQCCRRKKRTNGCECRSHLSPLQIQWFTELWNIGWTSGKSIPSVVNERKAPELVRGWGVTPSTLWTLGRCWVLVPWQRMLRGKAVAATRGNWMFSNLFQNDYKTAFFSISQLWDGLGVDRIGYFGTERWCSRWLWCQPSGWAGCWKWLKLSSCSSLSQPESMQVHCCSCNNLCSG